jgi:glycosyltransferase involved in cell wall biosynthesis
VNEDRFKVLKFLNHFYIGGTERQFVHVANGLDRSRFDVELGCLRREGPLLQQLNLNTPVHAYSVKGGFYHYRSIRNQLCLARDIRKRQYDIVHAYGWYPDIFAIPAARLALRPVIIASVRDSGAYMTPLKIRALKCICRLADCVLANSFAGRHWLLEQGIREDKIEVIHNGMVIPRHSGQAVRTGIRHEFGIPAGTPVCACIGRVISGKGIDFYIRASRILADQGRDVRFLMIGATSVEKSYQAEMEALARELNVNDRVIFTGQRQNVSDILREVDIVVHPSLTEGLSNVILEAMAAGLPVVATRAGGTPELVEDGLTGFLVAPRNAGQIAEAIARLVDQPAMAHGFGQAGRERIIKEFSIEEMLRKTETLYLRLMERALRHKGTKARREPAMARSAGQERSRS